MTTEQIELMKDALLYWEKFVSYTSPEKAMGGGIVMSLWQACLFEQARDAGRTALEGIKDD